MAQHEPRGCVAEGKPDARAQRADRRGLEQQRSDQAAPRHAQDTQQGKLRAPPQPPRAPAPKTRAARL